ncbi:MAG: tRNA (N(6)-L-threonylcarbamoyladenosine(37)-C(2))-methylthiotransferase [Methanothrix sp.]|jgi:MiaB-like tRNA modifying enzyme|uniref:tRNA-t(6)A37 methylthiotransferase n=1 Tax=Methanothrix harundinacea TaxID=301375 RepID=A0A101IKZ1_9EURY|nr:MAG: 2-methylthioadenine synthetase [Methanosaeta sp. SDB]KUK45524.1 MAG: MiaB-like tRNA modifying enzyme [Methanothrix harundinacea]MDD2637366.1 tRNA (N(6)-L-threonylcarbamoyladenosine(37)-C(2))-methylthiotransferase [Methanothrix sp.]MDI9399290.1 tRNA (N(6)-L-threonylcarbamoyladenosine(37)-C(2))-methylthiotransferase [Euryarchaeota archaeon]KUK97023.1 MAG: MiaB-like tRNA modifying enzyme [Methanothrix harundinacea]
MRFYLETYGCAANRGNSEAFSAALMEIGHLPSSLEEADLVIVNTCVVTERTERDMKKRLRDLQGERLVVAGCLPSAMPEAIRDIRCREVMGILDRSIGMETGETFRPEEIRPHRRQTPQNLCAVINISEGCRGQCSYCIVRRARGPLRSKTIQEVTREVRSHLAEGSVEIQLASQDAAAYGLDLGSALPELLDAVVGIDGDFSVRVGMMNPEQLSPILEDLIVSYDDPKIYKFLHLPVQSGSDRVLACMKRGYSARNFLEMVARFRSAFPHITLYTDVITGFPGETEEDFRATELLIQKADPDKVNVTMYSSRPGTGASKLKDMPSRIKKDRSRRITQLWQKIAGQRNGRYIGETIVAQVTEKGKEGTVMARSENYRKIIVREPTSLGCVHRFEVVETNPFYLKGEVVGRE